MAETLEFESPHFLQSLFAHDLALLKQLESSLEVRVTTRDGWIQLDGTEEAIARAQTVLGQLEEARRKGTDISPATFRYALDNATSDLPNEESVVDFASIRLLGTPTKPAVSPRTRGQYEYLKALREHDVVFGVGPAGTGKTYLAMAHALHCLKSREIDRIILSRPAVEAGEALGFLPGALEEKVAPYLRPLYDAMGDMLETDEARKFMERGMIEIAPLAYMRGRTLNRAVVILDEAQNASREQMLMFLTRLGEDSTCIVTGDPSQTDLRPRSRSGLLEAVNVLRGTEGVYFAEFEHKDVVRHPVVARIIQAYEASREAEEAERERDR